MAFRIGVAEVLIAQLDRGEGDANRSSFLR